MAEILPWNNAFNAAQGGGSIGVGGMSLPSGADMGSGAFMGALNAGRAAQASRQNLLMQREQMEMQRQKFQQEIGQDMTNMMLKQRELEQNKLFGSIFTNRTGEDGVVDFSGVIADMAKEELLRDKAPGIAQSMLEMGKVEGEGLKLRLENQASEGRAIAMGAFAVLQGAKQNNGNVDPGQTAQVVAKLIASGKVPKQLGMDMIKQMEVAGPKLNAQLKFVLQSSINQAQLTSDMMKQLFPEVLQVDRNGQTDFIEKQTSAGGTSLTPLGSLPDVPTIAESTTVQDFETPTGEIVPQRVPIMDQGAAAPAAPGAPGPAAVAAPELLRPQSPEVVAQRKAAEDRFAIELTTINTDSEKVRAGQVAVNEARDALKTFTPSGGMTRLRMPVAAAWEAINFPTVANAIAGGDLSGAQLFGSEAIKSAFSVIKSLGIVNRDLSKIETEMSEKATFSPNMTKRAAEAMLDNAEDVVEYQKARQKYMAAYLAQYKKNPRTALQRGFDLDQATSRFHADLAANRILPKRRWDFVPPEAPDAQQ